ncbi:Solute carrier family 40 member 2 [Exophiala dermatitidis]
MASKTHLTTSLYTSHFLSMWNARGFEFGAILFLATVYPGTLLPMSIYALLRALAAIALSPTLGRMIDSNDRLWIIRLSIVSQRLGVAMSCLIFALLFRHKADLSPIFVTALLGLLVVLACFEKLGSITNTVSVERDWVVVIAGADEAFLQALNAQMRRIDLFCKLVAPLAIALLHGWSPVIAVRATLITNVLSVGAEYFLIARVFHKVPALGDRADDRSRSRSTHTEPDDSNPIEMQQEQEQEQQQQQHITQTPSSSVITKYLLPIITPLRIYMSQPAFLPSLALSGLYLTVLSFSGQMTTFLLAIPDPKITSTMVGILRTISTISEISSTFVAPRAMDKIGPVRAGIWFLSWQTLCSSIAVGLLWMTTASSGLGSDRVILPLFITGVILSRFGLWSFDLCAQLIIQESILPAYRGSFSAVEMSLQNLFELCAFATTIAWPRPDQFRYPALVSLAALYLSAGLYAKFVRDRRGHLLHMPACLKGGERHRGHGHGGHGYHALPMDIDTRGRGGVSFSVSPAGPIA